MYSVSFNLSAELEKVKALPVVDVPASCCGLVFVYGVFNVSEYEYT